MFSINGTHARAVNDRWAYKISAGGYTLGRVCASDRDRFPTARPRRIRSFKNKGTTQPKFDTRVDYDAPERAYKLVFAGGYSGTEGIIHTGIGPFDMDAASASATARCATRAAR